MAEYTREQLERIFQKLPDELQEVIFSNETAEYIWNACVKNSVEDNRISEVARYAGRVLLGLVLPEEFQKTLEKEVGIKKDAAASIAREITRLVFFPVKESLRQLHSITEAAGSTAPQAKKAAPAAAAPTQEAPAPAIPKKEDTY